MLDEEVKQEIVSKEAIAAKDTSVKENNMAGFQRIEDMRECMSVGNITWSRKYGKLQYQLWKH